MLGADIVEAVSLAGSDQEDPRGVAAGAQHVQDLPLAAVEAGRGDGAPQRAAGLRVKLASGARQQVALEDNQSQNGFLAKRGAGRNEFDLHGLSNSRQKQGPRSPQGSNLTANSALFRFVQPCERRLCDAATHDLEQVHVRGAKNPWVNPKKSACT